MAGPTAHVWRNCQNAMNTYADSRKIDDPDASPSRPSVRFTAFEAAVSMMNAQK